MKKILLLFISLSMLFLVVACSKNTATEKTEEEIRAEIKEELKEELKGEMEEANIIEELSNEELISKKGEYEEKLHYFLNNIPDTYSGLFFDRDITQFVYYQENKEFKEFIDMIFSIGYGVEQAEGYYYLYVGEEVGYQDGEVDHSSNSSNEIIEIGEGVRLSGFTNETVRDVEINYSEYSAVIIPFYSGKNQDKLDKVPYLDNPEGMVLDFAVFGKLQDVVITRFEGIDDLDGVSNNYGEIENAILNIHSNLLNDMSFYLITGQVHTGEGFFEDVEFGLDDMADVSEFDVILIK